MKYILLFIFSVSFLSTSFSHDYQAIIDSANDNYTKGNYEKAIAYYHQILDSGYVASEIYYNLGNAYFRSNKTTKAIIQYERALQLDPADEDILFNLQLTNQYVVDKIDVLPEFFLKRWYKKNLSLFTVNEWAIISMGSFIFSLMFLLIYFLSRHSRQKRIGFWLGIFFLFVSATSFGFSYNLKNDAMARDEAIIVTPMVVVKSSPDESGTDLFVIHEGLKVNVTDEVGQWFEIKLSDGSKGWLLKTDLEII